MAKVIQHDDVRDDINTSGVGADTLQELIARSRQMVGRADKLIRFLHAQYELDPLVKVEAADQVDVLSREARSNSRAAPGPRERMARL